MYAVIESGGKQHRVVEGEILNVELLEAAAGDKERFCKKCDATIPQPGRRSERERTV